MDSLSHSGAQCARDCKRKYYYRYERRLQARRREVSDALSLGKAWHKTMEQYWATRDPSAIVLPDDPLDAIRVRAMLAGYIARWHSTSDSVVCSLSEQRVTAPIRNKRPSRTFQQLGILDMVALHRQLSGDFTWLWEHKTTGRLDPGYLARLSSDDQITGYVSALQDNGIEVTGVVYDVVVKLKLKVRKGDTHEDFEQRLTERYLTDSALYHRERLFIGPMQIADWRADLWQTTQEILHCRRAGIWPRNTGRCYDYFSTCEFHDLCINGGSEALIEADYEPRTYDDKPKQPAAELPF
jgi:hypothetical protein